MADYPNAPPPGGGAFVALGGLGIREGGIYTYNPNDPFFHGPTVQYWGQYTPMPTGPAPTAEPTVTGVNPTETSYALYGHTIPVSVLGRARIGGEIIAGPWIENGLATFCISYGFPADPSGTRDIREIAFDSEVVWSTSGASGVTTAAGGTFTVEAFTFRFYQGTLTQPADPIEIAHFGVDAVAYRPQILLWFENLPIANTKFKKIPYVSAVIGDGTGIDLNFGEMFERLAASPFVEFPDFETIGITDGVPDGGLILAQDYQFLQLIQQFGRFFPKWDILQTDKLRIVDRGNNVTADITLDKTRLMGQVVISRAEPNSVPSILELSTIDLDADYTIVPSRAQRPRVPVATTTSVKTETAYLPVVMDSATRQSVVTYTKYHEEQRRKQIRFKTTAYGVEVEPGDLVAITGLGDAFQDEVYKVAETTHGADYTVECAAESILRCDAGTGDPYLSDVVLLLGFGGADGSTALADESPQLQGLAGVVGNAQIDTSQSKFGGTSGYFDGTGPFLFVENDDFNLANGHFTIEAFIRPSTTVAGVRMIVGQWHLTLNLGWVLYQDGATLKWNVSTDGSNNFNDLAGGTLVANTWQAVCVEWDGTTQRLYLDGVMVDSSTTSRTIFNSPTAVSVGANGGSGFFFQGWIDEVRITKGVARYASDSGYSVPTTAFPRES